MEANHPPDIVALEAALDANERDARSLAADLTEESGRWRSEPGSWSVAECLDHLATGNRVYVHAMQGPAERAAAQKQVRRGPARPGLIGGWFVKTLEPPVTPMFKGKAPRLIRPRISPGLADAFGAFLASQNDVRRFLEDVQRHRFGRRAIPEPLHPRRPLQPRDRTARHRGARAASSLAGVERAPGRGTRRGEVMRQFHSGNPPFRNDQSRSSRRYKEHEELVVFGSSWFFVFHREPAPTPTADVGCWRALAATRAGA